CDEYEDSLATPRASKTRRYNPVSDYTPFFITIQCERNSNGALTFDGLDTQNQNTSIELKGHPIFAGEVDNYYNVDTNGKHPPPPILCTVHDTFWLLSPATSNVKRFVIMQDDCTYVDGMFKENRNAKICGSTFTEQIDTYASEYRGYWIHPKLFNYIAKWVSPKYATIVGEIMDKINERIVAEHNADPNTTISPHVHNVTNEFMNYKQEKIEQFKQMNIELRQDRQYFQTRAIPKVKKGSFCLIVEEVHQYGDQIKIQIRRQMKNTIQRGSLEYYKHDTVLSNDNIPIATIINEVIKEVFI
ncbi:MAG: hypothetical protein EZS28_014815, partial [Streblomastix strix]